MPNTDPAASLVEEFVAELVRAVGPEGTGAGLGQTGRRVALLIDHLVRMHLPGAAGACPDCRANHNGKPCITWQATASILTAWTVERVETQYGWLHARYPTDPSTGKLQVAVIVAVQ
jgi:hypothetical protein